MNPLPGELAARAAAGRDDLQRAEALAIGVSDSQLARWCAAGHLESQGFGAYVITAPLTSSDPFARARELHLRRAEAILGGLPGAYLVGRSAAWAWGAPLLREPGRVEVARRPRIRSDRSTLLSRAPWGRGAGPDAPRVQDRAECIVEVAAGDGVVAGLVVADALTHRGLAVAELFSATERYGVRSGVRFARLVAQHVEPATESPGESQLRWICVAHGIHLVSQFVVRDGRGAFVARVDHLVEGTNVVVEFDGLGKYTDVETLRAEKRRQVALERLGYLVLRFVHDDLAHPERVARTVAVAVQAQTQTQRGA